MHYQGKICRSTNKSKQKPTQELCKYFMKLSLNHSLSKSFWCCKHFSFFPLCHDPDFMKKKWNESMDLWILNKCAVKTEGIRHLQTKWLPAYSTHSSLLPFPDILSCSHITLTLNCPYTARNFSLHPLKSPWSLICLPFTPIDFPAPSPLSLLPFCPVFKSLHTPVFSICLWSKKIGCVLDEHLRPLL